MNSDKVLTGLSIVVNMSAKNADKKRMSAIAGKTSDKTHSNNNQCNIFLETNNSNRTKNEKIVQERLKKDPSYTGSRSDGVKLAWDYEKADVAMGGKGSGNWDKNQRKEILEKGKVRGQEGHHINNVVDHPEDQGNPDNIEFLDRKKHIKAHGGDFRNESYGPHIDKNKMLKRTNTKRNIKNEITGLSNACGPSVIKGFFDGCLESAGNTSVKKTVESGAKSAIKFGVRALADYGLFRLLKN